MMPWVSVNVYSPRDLIVTPSTPCSVNRGGREGGNGHTKGSLHRERERERETGPSR